MSEALRVVFLGTPEFAVASLEALVEAKVQVVAVVTAPDKPSGRGLKLHETPVKVSAQKLGLPILQPEKLKDPQFLKELQSYSADLQVVVAFRMLPEVVWNMPRLGTINLHASLLPQYRGAAPINWAVIKGETKTGVTTFFLKHEIDTGDLLFTDEESIEPTDTAGTLYEKLMHRGARLLVKTVKAIESGEYSTKPQVYNGALKKAPKLQKETGRLHFDQTAESVRNLIRGLNPYPGAWVLLNDKLCKVYEAQTTNMPIEEAHPGAFKIEANKRLFIACSDNWLEVMQLQPEGKKRMQTDEFLRGHTVYSLS
jgi:methionyl-tRNA formyltransferase